MLLPSYCSAGTGQTQSQLQRETEVGQEQTPALESLHLLQLILPTLPALPINLCTLYPILASLWQLFLSSSILVLVINAQCRHYRRTDQAPAVFRWTNSHPSFREQYPFACTLKCQLGRLSTSLRTCQSIISQFICCCLSLPFGELKVAFH